jgi:uncharacterized protein YgiM (DUF1202 family)
MGNSRLNTQEQLPPLVRQGRVSMQRRFLAIATIALVFLTTAALHLAVTQVALAQDTTAATDAPAPQPMRITFRQTIPLTITVAATAPLTSSANLTAEAASAIMGALLSNVAASDAVTESAAADAATEDAAAVTATEALTVTADAAAEESAVAEDAAIDATAALTVPVTASAAEFAVLLTVEFDVVMTDTLTTTVPALVTVQVADNLSATVTLSATLAPQPDGELSVELLPVAAPAATPEVATPEVITPTVEATDVATPTVAAPETTGPVPATIGDLAVIATTTVVTANVRSGPSTDFDQVTQLGPGTPIGLVAISEDGQWYLLTNGGWIAGFLVNDQPTELPIATQAIIDQVAAAAAQAATPEATEPASAAETPAVAPEVATPTPAPAPATPATVTTNANVRGGPGTEFPIIGGTITGQTVNIVGRNADSTWYLLDFENIATGWVSAELVANAPAAETIPVFNADGTPVVAPTATPVAGGSLALPTPTPVVAANTATATAATTNTTAAAAATAATAADPATTAYLASVTELVNAYDVALVALDTLIAEARANNSRLTDTAWVARLNTAVTQLRQTNATVGELQAPATLNAVQENLVAAARQYNLAANALLEASSTGVATLIDTADQAIQAANASLTAAEAASRAAGQ